MTIHNFCAKRTLWPGPCIYSDIIYTGHCADVAQADIIVGHSNQDNDAATAAEKQEEHLVDTQELDDDDLEHDDGALLLLLISGVLTLAHDSDKITYYGN